MGGQTANLSDIEALVAGFEELKGKGEQIKAFYEELSIDSSLGSAGDESSDRGGAYDSGVGHEDGGLPSWVKSNSDMSEQSADEASASTVGGGAGALSMAGDISEHSPDEADEVDEVDPRIKMLKKEVQKLQLESGLRQVQLNTLQRQRQEQLLNEEHYKEQLKTYRKALEEYEQEAKARARRQRPGRAQTGRFRDYEMTVPRKLHPLGAPLIF